MKPNTTQQRPKNASEVALAGSSAFTGGSSAFTGGSSTFTGGNAWAGRGFGTLLPSPPEDKLGWLTD